MILPVTGFPLFSHSTRLMLPSNIIKKNYKTLTQHSSTKGIFKEPPFTSYRRARNLGDCLVRAKDPQSTTPGSHQSGCPRCKTCPHILNTDSISITGHLGTKHFVTSSFTCTSSKHMHIGGIIHWLITRAVIFGALVSSFLR